MSASFVVVNMHEQIRGKCPAYGQTCSSCEKPHHFAVKCESTTGDSKRPSQKSKHRKVHQFTDSDDASYSSEEEILSVSAENAANSVEMTDYNARAKYLHTWNWLVHW